MKFRLCHCPQPWILQIPDPGIFTLGDENDGEDDGGKTLNPSDTQWQTYVVKIYLASDPLHDFFYLSANIEAILFSTIDAVRPMPPTVDKTKGETGHILFFFLARSEYSIEPIVYWNRIAQGD